MIWKTCSRKFLSCKIGKRMWCWGKISAFAGTHDKTSGVVDSTLEALDPFLSLYISGAKVENNYGTAFLCFLDNRGR